MREVEQKISELKDAKFNDLVKPCDAFITFEEEDGGIIAQEFEAEFTFSGKRLPAKQIFMGEELFFVESTEPTNIIWENRHFTPQDYLKRTMIVFGVIFLLLCASFISIFICKQFAISIASKYPPVDCADINTIYGDTIEKYAYKEHKNFYNP